MHASYLWLLFVAFVHAQLQVDKGLVFAQRSQIVRTMFRHAEFDSGTPCSGGEGQCSGHDAGCCRTNSSTYTCCNFPTNVCCDDGLHCCPTGTVCKQNTLTCLRDQPPSDSSATTRMDETAATMISASNANHTSNRRWFQPPRNQYQSGQQEKCRCAGDRNRTTCCPGEEGILKCCPLQNAVCCPGGEHCCPQGFICTGTCQSETSTPPIEATRVNLDLSSHLSSQVDADMATKPHSQAFNDTAGDKCDVVWSCPNGRCCINFSLNWYCCPNASFCNHAQSNCIQTNETGKIDLQPSIGSVSGMSVMAHFLGDYVPKP